MPLVFSSQDMVRSTNSLAFPDWLDKYEVSDEDLEIIVYQARTPEVFSTVSERGVTFYNYHYEYPNSQEELSGCEHRSNCTVEVSGLSQAEATNFRNVDLHLVPLVLPKPAGDELCEQSIPSKASPGGKLTSHNVGFRLLQKMGWREGSGLGKYYSSPSFFFFFYTAFHHDRTNTYNYTNSLSLSHTHSLLFNTFTPTTTHIQHLHTHSHTHTHTHIQRVCVCVSCMDWFYYKCSLLLLCFCYCKTFRQKM